MNANNSTDLQLSSKKVYSVPRLLVSGSIEQLTQSNGPNFQIDVPTYSALDPDNIIAVVS